jgi:transposase InsO family protein
MTDLCEHYGISRKTGYKWTGRYEREGVVGLADRSHAPVRHGRSTPPLIVEGLLREKESHPSWGPRKLVVRLSGLHPDVAWPAASTAGEILKRAGLVSGRRLRVRAPPTLGALTEPNRPNHVWAVDHKGWVRLRDGTRCEPLTITDGFSRFLVSVSATGSTACDEAKPLFERAFREFGLPDVIRSDNGVPFASAGISGLTTLSVWWLKLGIAHERIAPGRPQQNGRHERFHRTLLEAMQPRSADRGEQERRFETFRAEYNEERPHEALGQTPPGRHYQPSPRPLPDRLAEPEYTEDAAVRSVRSNGMIKWRGAFVFVSEALIGERVAVVETENGDWQVTFFNYPLGVIDPRRNRLRRIPIAVHCDRNTNKQT